MRFLAPTLLVASVMFAVAGSAYAAPADMNDSTYLAVARCAGMAEGVGVDAKPFNTALDTQSQVRTPDVVDRANEVKNDAKRKASHEGAEGKATIGQQLDGSCKSYISAG